MHSATNSSRRRAPTKHARRALFLTQQQQQKTTINHLTLCCLSKCRVLRLSHSSANFRWDDDYAEDEEDLSAEAHTHRYNNGSKKPPAAGVSAAEIHKLQTRTYES
jgi:hypothetical protein